jgi:hypothetical protein
MMSNDLDEPCAVLHGTPVDGYKLAGPFLSEDDALEWAKDAFQKGDPYWWVLPIEEPEFEVLDPDVLDACGKCGSCLACDCNIVDMTPPMPTYALDGI